MAALPRRSQSEESQSLGLANEGAARALREGTARRGGPPRPLGSGGARRDARTPQTDKSAGHGSGTSQHPRGRPGGPAAVYARRPLTLPREHARRGSAGPAGARGRHPVRQRLAPAARPARARRGRAARARVRRPVRGPAGAPGAHLRRHGGRGARRRRLPRLLQERPQPLSRRLHRLPHAAPQPQPGTGLPGGEESPPRGRAQPGLLGSAPEVRGGPAAPAPGALGRRRAAGRALRLQPPAPSPTAGRGASRGRSVLPRCHAGVPIFRIFLKCSGTGSSETAPPLVGRLIRQDLVGKIKTA